MSTNDQQTQTNLLDQAGNLANVLGGHAQLANGATQEQIGNLLNSDEWKKSGLDVKGDAVDNIKKAFEEYKAQGGSVDDKDKIGQLADKACPETGEGLGSNQQSN